MRLHTKRKHWGVNGSGEEVTSLFLWLDGLTLLSKPWNIYYLRYTLFTKVDKVE